MRLRVLLVAALCASTSTFAQDCPPTGHTKQTLLTLRAQQFAVPDAPAKQRLAEGLLACLGNADPELRDEIAYEALSEWMRRGDFDAATLRAIRDRLVAMLDGDPGPGF